LIGVTGTSVSSPLACPRCGSRLASTERARAWRCAGGHRFESIRTLIAALLATGWRPAIQSRAAAPADRTPVAPLFADLPR